MSLGCIGQFQRDAEPSAFAIGEMNAPTVGFGDFPGQCEPEPGAAALGRIERQQRLRKHGLAHAGASIAHLYALMRPGMRNQQFHLALIAPGLVRVLQ